MDEPTLAGLSTFEWDSNEAVAYEVAIEAISEAVACYTALVDQSEQDGDAGRGRELAAAQARCIVERDQLRSTDHADVARVRREYPQLTTALRQQMR
jgi:hypothetical protein